MKRFFLIFVSILLSHNIIYAQWISGNVTFYHHDIPTFADIVIRGTNKGTSTDVDGNYRIEVDSTHKTLVFLFSTGHSQEIEIGKDSIINVSFIGEDFQLLLR